MIRSKESVKPPSLWLTLVDPARTVAEATSILAYYPYLRSLPKGDGHPVVVFPGFIVNDWNNAPVIRYLRVQGYHATGWKRGLNLGQGLIEPSSLIRRIKRLKRREGKKLSLIGHSLGGIYAREIARLCPNEVKQVITLGTPFASNRDQASRLRQLYLTLSPHDGEEDDSLWPIAPPVPTTSIYSRTDGVVDWRVTMQEGGHAQTENIEVYSSHNGMLISPMVWYILSDRLSQSEENWLAFERSGCRKLAFPKALEASQKG